MKPVKASAIREMNPGEVEIKLSDAREELMKLRFQQVTGPPTAWTTPESGAHTVNDYADTPERPNGRDDAVWMKHRLWYSEGDRLDYKPVNLKPLTAESIPPKVRTF